MYKRKFHSNINLNISSTRKLIPKLPLPHLFTKNIKPTTVCEEKIFKLKPFLKSPFNFYFYNYITAWPQLHNHYKAYMIGLIIKKICRYEGLGLNRLFIQLTYNNVKVLIDNLGFFTEHHAQSKFNRYKKNFRHKYFKKRIVKIAASILTYINTKSVEVNVYTRYSSKNSQIKIAARVFKKEKKEQYFIPSFQGINAVFSGVASSRILGNLICTYTRRNPRRIRFISFVKRLIDWHFVTLAGLKSKISGVRVEIKGRFTAKSRAKKQILSVGRLRINEGSSPVDYQQLVTITKFGSLGIKIWVCPQM